MQLDLILDYRTNVVLYPAFQAYFREYRPPFLAVWGRHDPAFLPAGALAYKRDLPDAEVHLLNTGHFALETHHYEMPHIFGTSLAEVSGIMQKVSAQALARGPEPTDLLTHETPRSA